MQNADTCLKATYPPTDIAFLLTFNQTWLQMVIVWYVEYEINVEFEQSLLINPTLKIFASFVCMDLKMKTHYEV